MLNGKLAGHLATGIAYVIFGLNIVLCKDITNSGLVSPLGIFTMRALGACSLFWLVSLFSGREKVSHKDLLKLIVASMLSLFIPQFTFLMAVNIATAIDVSIISTLTPIFTMFVAAIALKEPITGKKAGGVALSFFGILLLILNSASSTNGLGQSNIGGILLMMVNTLSFAAYLGIFRPLIAKYKVVTVMKWMFLFSLLVALPFSFKEVISIDYTSLPVNVGLDLAFVIFFATFVSYFLVPIGQKNLRPTLVSIYSYLQPIVASIIAIITGMDTLNWKKIVAVILVFLGVYLVNKSRSAAESKVK